MPNSNSAGKPAARQGDATAHGGAITAGDSTVIIGGRPAARIGDAHNCPASEGAKPHVGGPVASGSGTVNIGYKSAARVRDRAACNGPPDAIAAGCDTVNIGD